MSNSNQSLTKKRIVLYVDDGLRSTRFIPRLLQHFGYKVVETDYGKDILQKVHQLSPDIIFLDYLRDLTVCRQLKADKRAKDIPIIVILYSEDEDLRKELIREGVNDYIIKPIDVDEFEGLVKSYFTDRVWGN